MAATAYYLKIDGIPGESADSKHKDWIVVESFTWGADPSGPSGPLGSRPVELRDLCLRKGPDRASPLLFSYCAAGERMRSALLSVLQSPDQAERITYKMTDLLVSSFHQGGSADNLPSETVSLHFASLEETVPGDGKTPPPGVLKGDVDGDGRVGIGDVLTALRLALRGGPAPNPNALWAADVNNDGVVTLGDAIAILRYAVLGDPFPGQSA